MSLAAFVATPETREAATEDGTRGLPESDEQDHDCGAAKA